MRLGVPCCRLQQRGRSAGRSGGEVQRRPLDEPQQQLRSRAVRLSAIDQLFASSGASTRTFSEKAAGQSEQNSSFNTAFFIKTVVGAAFFTLLFLTGNTMMQAVRERIPELAVLKTLGFTGGRVSILVLIESMMLCLFAAIVGLVLSAGAMKGVGAVLGPAKLPASVVLAGLGIAVLLAVISGLPPALRAQRLNIVDALAGR